MLLANITVATALHDAYPKIAFLRQHSPPLKQMLDKLREQLEASGIIIDTSSSKALQQSLIACRDSSNAAGLARSLALSSLLSKPMAVRFVFLQWWFSKTTPFISANEICLEVSASSWQVSYCFFFTAVRQLYGVCLSETDTKSGFRLASTGRD